MLCVSLSKTTTTDFTTANEYSIVDVKIKVCSFVIDVLLAFFESFAVWSQKRLALIQTGQIRLDILREYQMYAATTLRFLFAS